MEKRKIFTKKNLFILFLLSSLGAITIAGMIRVKDVSERLHSAQAQIQNTESQLVVVQNEKVELEKLLVIHKEHECSTETVEVFVPIRVPCPDVPVCPEIPDIPLCPDIECPEPIVPEPEVVTIRVVEEKEVIKEIKVPVKCNDPVKPVSKLERFTPYVDLLARTDKSAGARVGVDKEVVNKKAMSMRLFAEVSHDFIQEELDPVSVEYPYYYCEESECTYEIDTPEQDKTRGIFGIRFRF